MLLLVTGVAYAVHHAVFTFLHPNEPLDLVNFSYKFNVGISLLFTSSMILASEHLKEQLGFIFLITGMVKLGLYAYLIKSSGFDMDKSVFLHFFVPYVVCIVVEIIYISKILKRTNFSKHK